jgi:hypothetical protein
MPFNPNNDDHASGPYHTNPEPEMPLGLFCPRFHILLLGLLHHAGAGRIWTRSRLHVKPSTILTALQTGLYADVLHANNIALLIHGSVSPVKLQIASASTDGDSDGGRLPLEKNLEKKGDSEGAMNQKEGQSRS